MKWKLLSLFFIAFVFFIPVDAQTTVGFKEQYYDSGGIAHDFNNENLNEHPIYDVVDRGRYYVITRFGVWEDLPKQITCLDREIEVRYSFYPERIVPQIKLDNYSQISNCVTKTSPTVWYWTLPFNAAQYKSVTDDLIDMGVFKRTTKVTVSDSNTSCGYNETMVSNCTVYSVVPKVVNTDIRLYFNPQNYSGVVYPLYLTENTVTIDNATFWSTQDCGEGFWSAYGGGSCGTPLNSLIYANLTAYYDLESTTGTTEFGINKFGKFPNNSIQGTWNGNTTINYTSGQYWGNGLNPDGINDYVSLPALGVGGNVARSMFTVIKPSVLGSGVDAFLAWSNAGTRDTSNILYYNLSATNNTYYAFSDDDWYTATGTVLRGSFSDINWLFKGGTTSLTNPEAYINNVQKTTTKAGGFNNPSTTNANYYIAVDNPVGGNFFNGIIDEVVILNSSSQQINSTSMYGTAWNKTFLNNTVPDNSYISAVKFNIYNLNVQGNTANISTRQNGTGAWTQIATNYSGDNTTWINGTWWQNTDFSVNVSGNGSSRAFIISMTYDKTLFPTFELTGYVNNTLGAFVDGVLVTINGASALSRTTYKRNNTDLCQYNHTSNLCDGTRQSGIFYNASSELQLIVFAHANNVSQTADVIVNIDGTNVTYNTGRPLGAAEMSYKETTITIPLYSNYTVYFANFHHYEWREYPLVHGYYNLTSLSGNQSVLARQVGYAIFTGTLNVNANMTYNITLQEKETVNEATVIDYSIVGAMLGGLLAFVLLRRKRKDDDYKYKRE